MTYRQLLRILQNRTDCYLDDDVTVYDKSEDKCYPVIFAKVNGKELELDIVDDDLLVLEIRSY